MTRDLELTPERFERLLDWLDADREQAAARYALIQLRLVRFFASRRWVDAESLADETINVVASRVDKDEELLNYVGDRSLYFYGVAKNVDRQHRRRLPDESLSELNIQPAVEPEPEPDLLGTLLDECIKELEPADQRLVLEYHVKDKQEKIRYRKVLAREEGTSLNALRIKMYRLHLQIRKCIERRLREIPDQ